MSMAEDTNQKAGGSGRLAEYLAAHLREYGLLFALIAIMAFFQIVTDGTLLRAVNVTNLLLQNSYIVIMALGMLVVIVSGNIDLSVGSVMGFIGALAAVQKRMLQKAATLLKPGGPLVYCTCSLEREEGEDQIEAFLKRTPEARLDPVTEAELPGLKEAITADGAVRTRPDMWSERGGMDGFYIARIVKG